VSGAPGGGQSNQEPMRAAWLCQAAMDQGALQKPEELGGLIELLQDERLMTVVEIGTAHGGTLLVWCRLAAPDATIVSIDLPGGPFGGLQVDRTPSLEPLAGPGQTLHLLRMDSGRQGTRREVERILKHRQIDLLFIDGDHSYYGVRTDFQLYGPLVRDGGLIVFHDINSSSSDPAVEVRRVWQQLKRTYEWREIVHQQPAPTFGGFGVLRWTTAQQVAPVDPSVDGTGFALPRAFSGPPSEPALDVKTAGGQLLLPRRDRVMTRELAAHGVWKPATTDWLRSTLRPGQTFVDVGAHVGYFSVLASRLVGPTGAVIAVEPESRNLDLLRRNLARNDCTNSLVVPFAAHSMRAWMSLALDQENRGGHRLVRLGAARTRVRCVRLDDVLPPNVDVVKIDAQGYDHDIVEGLERTLATNPQLIVIVELSAKELGRRRVDPGWVLARYESLGFDLSVFDGGRCLRRLSSEEVLANCRAEGRHVGLSVILSRAEQGRLAARSRAHPAKVEGLEVNVASGGMTVFQAARNRVHQLNPSAALVFDLCTGDNPLAEIIELVQKVYGLPDPPAAEVRRCLDRLYEEGLVR
jgi:FkbM family methyltransferase